jgi:hypothetical protein
MTLDETIAKVLRLTAQREADERRQLITDLLITSEGDVDDDYLQAIVEWHAEQWAAHRIEVIAQVRQEVMQ